MTMSLFNSRLKVVIVLGFIWMVISLVVFLIVTDEPTSTQKIGLFFLLLSEALITGLLALQELVPQGTGPLFRVGTYVAATVYAVLSLSNALVHTLGLATSSTFLIVFEVVLFGLLISIELVLYLSSKGVSATDRVTSAKMGLAMELRTRLDNLAKLNTLPPDILERLKRVIEEVRYFDKNSSVASDTTIGDKITQLEAIFAKSAGDAPTGAVALLDEILALTQIRKRESADSQRGGF
jgi:hypothetical protein